MSNSSKKKQFGMNIGSASILLVFVILCLVSFAVLSIVSANADSRLSTRSTQHQTRSSRERVLRTVLRRALASADSALRS